MHSRGDLPKGDLQTVFVSNLMRVPRIQMLFDKVHKHTLKHLQCSENLARGHLTALYQTLHNYHNIIIINYLSFHYYYFKIMNTLSFFSITLENWEGRGRYLCVRYVGKRYCFVRYFWGEYVTVRMWDNVKSNTSMGCIVLSDIFEESIFELWMSLWDIV